MEKEELADELEEIGKEFDEVYKKTNFGKERKKNVSFSTGNINDKFTHRRSGC